MGSLVQTAQAAYDTWAAENLPTTTEAWVLLTDAQVISLYRTQGQLKQAIVDAQAKETIFYTSRSEAFAAFEAKKQSELVALQILWQAKEDNGFDAEFVPQ